MKANVDINIDIKMEAWALCPPNMTLEAFVTRLQEIGNTVLQIDHEQNRVLIGKVD